MRYLTVLAVMLMVANCATPVGPNQTELTFVTVPHGAMLYEGQTAWGMAPQKKVFNSRNGGTTTGTVTAIWSSGARMTQTFNVTLGTRQIATMSRPPNAPGMDKDLAFAEQLRHREEARHAANDAALGAAIRAAFPPPPPPNPVVNCTSTKIGGQIQTTCF